MLNPKTRLCTLESIIVTISKKCTRLHENKAKDFQVVNALFLDIVCI